MMSEAARNGNLEAVKILQSQVPAGETLGSVPLRRAAERLNTDVMDFLRLVQSPVEAITSYDVVKDHYHPLHGKRGALLPSRNAIRQLLTLTTDAERQHLLVHSEHLVAGLLEPEPSPAVFVAKRRPRF